jgi:hypothetical protein
MHYCALTILMETSLSINCCVNARIQPKPNLRDMDTVQSVSKGMWISPQIVIRQTQGHVLPQARDPFWKRC